MEDQSSRMTDFVSGCLSVVTVLNWTASHRGCRRSLTSQTRGSGSCVGNDVGVQLPLAPTSHSEARPIDPISWNPARTYNSAASGADST